MIVKRRKNCTCLPLLPQTGAKTPKQAQRQTLPSLTPLTLLASGKINFNLILNPQKF
jgi:hypothetical protein